MGDKSVFERMDEQDTKIDKISQKIDLFLSSNLVDSKESDEESERILTKFIKTADKKYFWFGKDDDFIRQNKILLIFNLVLFLLIFSSFIFAAFSKGDDKYLIFLLNIISLFYLRKFFAIKKTEKIIDHNDLYPKSSFDYYLSIDKYWVSDFKEKKSFKVIRIILIIFLVISIPVIFVNFDMMFLMSYISLVISYIIMKIISKREEYFYFSYLAVLFTNKNEKTNEVHTLVYFQIKNELILFDEFKEKYKNAIN